MRGHTLLGIERESPIVLETRAAIDTIHGQDCFLMLQDNAEYGCV